MRELNRTNDTSRRATMMPRRVALPLIFLGALCLLSAGCGRDEPKETGAAEDQPIRRTFERGPVTVSLEVDHASISIADRLNLKVEVTADEAYEVELPRFGDKLQQFGIVDYETSEPKLVDEKRKRLGRSYVLEPFLSGDYKIPPMTVRFWKEGEEDNPHEVETEEITVSVTSLLPDDVEGLTIHDVTGPVDLPRSKGPWAVAAVAGALAAVIAVAGFVLWRRRRTPAAIAARIPAHEIAFRELQKLIDEDLPGKGQIKLFYQLLTDILRRYIENRFGLHAPEDTTEEFLDELRGNDTLNSRYRSLLEGFLKHCDLVKFAEHQPRTDEIQGTFDSCKTFIVETQIAERSKVSGGATT